MADKGAGVVGQVLEDAYWEAVLGVEMDDVDGIANDAEALRAWLKRFSPPFRWALMRWVGERAPGPLRGEPEDVLVEDEVRPLVREAVAVDRYLQGRRREALNEMSAIVRSWNPPPASAEGVAPGEKFVLEALHAARHAPDRLLWYALLDRGVRVRYREYRLAGGRGQALGALEGELSRVDLHRAERALAAIAGERMRTRCLGVIPHPSGGRSIFALIEGEEQSVRQIEGVRHISRARWLILRFSESGTRLQVHGAEELGVALAGALASGATGDAQVDYRPYRPETPAEEVRAFMERMLAESGEDVYDLEVSVAGGGRVFWRIYGDVRRGLEPLRRWAGEEQAGGGIEWNRVSFRCRPGQAFGTSRVTLWALPGSTEATRLVEYRIYGADHAERDAVVSWLAERGLRAFPS